MLVSPDPQHSDRDTGDHFRSATIERFLRIATWTMSPQVLRIIQCMIEEGGNARRSAGDRTAVTGKERTTG